jgi:hypothetical protein
LSTENEIAQVSACAADDRPTPASTVRAAAARKAVECGMAMILA